MTGFEPATPRPPGVYATGLRYIPIPIRVAKITKHSNWQGRNFICFKAYCVPYNKKSFL